MTHVLGGILAALLLIAAGGCALVALDASPDHGIPYSDIIPALLSGAIFAVAAAAVVFWLVM